MKQFDWFLSVRDLSIDHVWHHTTSKQDFFDILTVYSCHLWTLFYEKYGRKHHGINTRLVNRNSWDDMSTTVFLLELKYGSLYYIMHVEPNETLKADPKGHVLRHNKKCKHLLKVHRVGVKRAEQPTRTKAGVYKDNAKALEFLKDRPYGYLTAFGIATLIDPQRKIASAVFQERKDISFMGLEEGEALAMEYLREGSYYSTTGKYTTNDIYGS